MKKQFILAHPVARQRAIDAVREAPEGYAVTVAEPTRNLEQNAKFHAICTDLSRSGLQWMGKERSAEQWKVLLVSGHAVVTKQEVDLVPGLEGEFVNLRESTALMSKRRSGSLIEYSIAFAVSRGIELGDEVTC
jgi:hypothetical protein